MILDDCVRTASISATPTRYPPTLGMRRQVDMPTITQADRALSIRSSLGADVLLLTGFSGTESISRLFTYQLELASENDSIAAKDIVGKDVTWSVSHIDQAPRYFNGFVRRFVAGSLSRRSLRTTGAGGSPCPRSRPPRPTSGSFRTRRPRASSKGSLAASASAAFNSMSKVPA